MVLGFLALLGVLSLKREYVNASLAQNLRGKLRNGESYSEVEIPRELLISIKAQLEQKSGDLA
jgi:hypothetical protein